MIYHSTHPYATHLVRPNIVFLHDQPVATLFFATSHQSPPTSLSGKTILLFAMDENLDRLTLHVFNTLSLYIYIAEKMICPQYI